MQGQTDSEKQGSHRKTTLKTGERLADVTVLIHCLRDNSTF